MQQVQWLEELVGTCMLAELFWALVTQLSKSMEGKTGYHHLVPSYRVHLEFQKPGDVELSRTRCGVCRDVRHSNACALLICNLFITGGLPRACDKPQVSCVCVWCLTEWAASQRTGSVVAQ